MNEGNVTGGAQEHRRGGRAFGYAVEVVINAVLLYVAHNLVRWGFLPFITPAFDRVLWAFELSLGVTMGLKAALIFYDPAWLRHMLQAISAAVGIVAPVALLTVFPFAVSPAWSTALRIAFVVGIAGSAIGAVVELSKALGGLASREA